jgi:hypothetical protein
MSAHRLIAGLMALLLGAAPFAFVLCGLDCAHAAAAAAEQAGSAHACHDETSGPLADGSVVRGVAPRCTHADEDRPSVVRLEPTFLVGPAVAVLTGLAGDARLGEGRRADVAREASSTGHATTLLSLRI